MFIIDFYHIFNVNDKKLIAITEVDRDKIDTLLSKVLLKSIFNNEDEILKYARKATN